MQFLSLKLKVPLKILQYRSAFWMVFVVKGHFHSISKAAMSELCQKGNWWLDKVPVAILTDIIREFFSAQFNYYRLIVQIIRTTCLCRWCTRRTKIVTTGQSSPTCRYPSTADCPSTPTGHSPSPPTGDIYARETKTVRTSCLKFLNFIPYWDKWKARVSTV